MILNFNLQLDINDDGVTTASLFDADEPFDLPLAEATAGSADVAVDLLMQEVTFNFQTPEVG